jgi:hypothetical protein
MRKPERTVYFRLLPFPHAGHDSRDASYHLSFAPEVRDRLDRPAPYRTLVFIFIPGDGKKVQFLAVTMAQLA